MPCIYLLTGNKTSDFKWEENYCNDNGVFEINYNKCIANTELIAYRAALVPK